MDFQTLKFTINCIYGLALILIWWRGLECICEIGDSAIPVEYRS